MRNRSKKKSLISLGRRDEHVAEQQKPTGKLDEAEREKLRRIGEGLRHVHSAGVAALPTEIAEALKWLEK